MLWVLENEKTKNFCIRDLQFFRLKNVLFQNLVAKIVHDWILTTQFNFSIPNFEKKSENFIKFHCTIWQYFLKEVP